MPVPPPFTENTPLVFFRGLGRESGHWGPFLGQVRDAFPGLRVEALDFPGTGVLRNEPFPKSIQSAAKQMQLRLRRDFQGPVTLFAVSLGGMIAQSILDQDPELVKNVILLNTSTRDSGSIWQRMQWGGLVRFVQALRAKNLEDRERKILQAVSNDPLKREVYLPYWVKIARERPISMKVILSQLRAAAKFSAPTLEAQKVFLIRSLGDRLVDPACSQYLQDRWNCPMETHTWAGHDLAIDDPEWLIDILRKNFFP